MKFWTGQIIKNYIELCKILDVEPTKGKGRIYHIREFERYCKHHKEGQKFIVDEVYPEPLPKIDLRANNGANTNVYDDLMDNIILNTLINLDGIIIDSYTGMVDILELFTPEYKTLYQVTYKRYAEINKLGVGIVKEYQQHIYNKVKNCIDTSLNRLKRNGIIDFEIKLIVRDNKFNEDFADDKLKKEIKETVSRIYKEKGWTYSKLIVPDNNRKFKNEVSKEVGINNYWNVYYIELINKDMDYVEEDKDELIRRLIKTVNNSVQNKEMADSTGNKFKPYSFDKYQLQIDILTKLLWNLPEDYTSEYDLKQLLTGKDIEEETTDITEDDSNEDFEEYYSINYGCIPF